MPKASKTNNVQQQQPKRVIITADIDKVSMSQGDIRELYVITIYSDEAASKTMADWTNKKGNNPFKIGRSPKSVIFKIPVDAMDQFLQSNMYRVVEGALKYNGFTMDANTFKATVERESKTDVSSEDIGKLDTSMDKLMDAMLDHFEGKIDDPMVAQLLSQMHMFDPMTGRFKTLNDFLKKNIKSANNIMQICAQWRNNNRPGVPTYVATKAQWSKYNRYVVNDATPLVMSTPNDNKVQGIRKTLSDNGLSYRDYRDNSHIRHTARSIYNDHGSQQNAANGFHGEYVFDVSDTEVLPGMPDLFNMHEGLSSNLWVDKWNQKAMDQGINPDSVKDDNDKAVSAGFSDDANNAEKIKSALTQWCQDNPRLSAAVENALRNNNIVNAVTEYFKTESYIDREKSPNIKNALLSMCVFAALNHYGIAPADMLKNFQSARSYLVQNNRIPKSVRVKFMPFYSNFVHMVETNAKKAAVQECKNINNQFSSLWNRIVMVEERKRNEVIW